MSFLRNLYLFPGTSSRADGDAYMAVKNYRAAEQAYREAKRDFDKAPSGKYYSEHVQALAEDAQALADKRSGRKRH